VISQCLVPKAEGRGRCCAMEILVGTAGVRNLIREGKTHQINNMVQSGGNVGMITLNAALKRLVQEGKVSVDAAIEKSNNPDELRALLGGGTWNG
jgi:twitching motility protein PilT